jgi:O-antigen ligase
MSVTARARVVEVSWFAALETGLFAVFVGGLALTPVWLGGNRLICWGIHAVLFCGLLFLLEAGVLVSRRRHTVGLTYLRTPAVLLGATVIWILIQTVSYVPDSWQHPIWSIAAVALETPLPGSISVNPDLTLLALVRLLTAVAVFWLALQLCRDAKRANALLASLAVTGFVYATYGILAMAIAPTSNLWLKKDAYVGFVTATFVNRNSFASFAGVTLLAAIGITLRLFRREIDRDHASWRRTLSRAIEATGKRGVFLLVMIFTIVMALLLSGSRAGITSTALGIFVLTTLVIARAERRRAGQIATILTACAVILAAFLAYGDLFVGRLDSLSVDAGGREAAYAIVVASIRDAPMLGFGYGTFQDVFPMYRDASVGLGGTWDKAHNTYLEIFQGLGLVFGAAFLAAIGLLVWRCVQAAVVRRQASTVPIAAAAASVLLGVHALVDFSLQIQSITLIWSALLGAGVAQSWSSRKELDLV